MDDKMLGWQRPHGQAGIVIIMVRQNGVASEIFGSLASGVTLQDKSRGQH